MAHKRAKQDEHPIIIDETDTAELIGVSPTTLRTWRCRGGGPPFYRLGGGRRGRIRYDRTEVFAWLRAGRVDQPGRG